MRAPAVVACLGLALDALACGRAGEERAASAGAVEIDLAARVRDGHRPAGGNRASSCSRPGGRSTSSSGYPTRDVSAEQPIVTGSLASAIAERSPSLRGTAAGAPTEAIPAEVQRKLGAALRALGYAQ